MTFEDYLAIDAVNISTLLHMAKSPAHYRHALMPGAGKDTTALAFGRLVHMAILEPDRYAAEVAIWDGGRRAGKEWTAWQLANAGRVQATEDEHEQCIAMSAAVNGHRAAGAYLASAAALTEQTVKWRHGLGIDCKGRLDWVDPGQNLVIDLKTTRDATEFEFGRAAARYKYHTRAAWYADGCAARFGEMPGFVLIAVEKEPPYAVAVYRIGDQALDMGRNDYEKLLIQLKVCRERDEWPGICGDSETELMLPEWLYAQADGLELDLSGLDREEG